MENKAYQKFVMMLSASFIIMYFVMYLNVDAADHVYLNVTRVYMSLLMVTPMALLMLVMMKHMYKNKKKNAIIALSAVVVFALALILLRSQTPIKDIQYMKAMIPHHSSAILTSENADISDPEVKELAGKIISSQKEEISKMKQLIERLSGGSEIGK